MDMDDNKKKLIATVVNSASNHETSSMIKDVIKEEVSLRNKVKDIFEGVREESFNIGYVIRNSLIELNRDIENGNVSFKGVSDVESAEKQLAIFRKESKKISEARQYLQHAVFIVLKNNMDINILNKEELLTSAKEIPAEQVIDNSTKNITVLNEEGKEHVTIGLPKTDGDLSSISTESLMKVIDSEEVTIAALKKIYEITDSRYGGIEESLISEGMTPKPLIDMIKKELGRRKEKEAKNPENAINDANLSEGRVTSLSTNRRLSP